MDTIIASDLLDSILDAEHSLLLLRCDDAPTLLEQLRRHAIRTGVALYAWDEDAGLRSLRDAQSTAPSSRRFGEALRHIIQSAHFGIYFFAQYPQVFDAALIPLLRQVSRLRGEHARRVVLIGAEFELPAGVEAGELPFGAAAPVRPRLRDGRWIQGVAR